MSVTLDLMTDAKRKKAVAAIRQIITAAHVLVEIEDPASAQSATPAHGEVENAASVAVETGEEVTNVQVCTGA